MPAPPTGEISHSLSRTCIPTTQDGEVHRFVQGIRALLEGLEAGSRGGAMIPSLVWDCTRWGALSQVPAPMATAVGVSSVAAQAMVVGASSWKREYFYIFTLLPLEYFPLEKWEKGKEHHIEEDDDRWLYRLIPCTIGNWLQAFMILGSVCSALFCYLDSIWEAHRVSGETAWLRYDEQFQQRMSVCSDFNWDHRGIGIWM